MNPTQHPPITRKQLSLLLGVTVRQIARNEKKWGLDKLRVPFCTREIHYRHGPVMLWLSGWGN